MEGKSADGFSAYVILYDLIINVIKSNEIFVWNVSNKKHWITKHKGRFIKKAHLCYCYIGKNFVCNILYGGKQGRQ